MIINLIYLFVVVISIIYGIAIFIQIRHKMIPFGLAILLFGLVLEIQWLNEGNYIIYTSDFFWKIKDIIRMILIIRRFRQLNIIEIQKKEKKVLVMMEKELYKKEKKINPKLEQINTELEQIKTEKEEQRIRLEQNRNQ